LLGDSVVIDTKCWLVLYISEKDISLFSLQKQTLC